MTNYHRWIDRLQVIERQFRTSSVYLSLLIICSLVLGALCFNVGSTYLASKVAPSVDPTETLSAQLKTQANTLAARNMELALEREANANMQAMFVEQEEKQQALARELAFYRSVMAPENSADGVAINGLEISAGLMPRHYRLKLVLTQLEKRKRFVSGRSELIFIGLEDGKPKSIKLSELSDISLKFKFRYFEVLEAEFTLPENFILSRVKVKVTVPSSRWAKGSQIEQEYSSQELSVNENEQSIVLEQNGQVLDNSVQKLDVRGNND